MKNKGLLLVIPALLAAALPSLINQKSNPKVALGISVPTTLDLNDTTDEQIKNYYSSLSNKSSDELQGENLLKNLKGIIANNVTYFSYNQSASIYAVTDRDWVNSPATTLAGTYNPETNKVTGFSHSKDIEQNPYIRMLYHDYTLKDKTHYDGEGDVSTSSKSFDNEHVWSQTHGFADTKNKNLTGAASDLHHLIAGTQYGNRTLHNNYSYGFVKANDGDWSSKIYETKNKRGAPLFPHSEDQQAKVFEPQDSDKGDIARALLYMVACYNNLDGSVPTQTNPALKLVNYVISENTTGFSSDDLTKGYYGTLQDILAWHHMDPVDEYEIHRNNLIYNNYQHNRNPFIDYPEWVDYIWGVSEYDSINKTINYDSTPTGYVDLNNDVINGYSDDDTKVATKIEITNMPSKTTYYEDDELDVTGLVVMATYEDESTKDVTKKCTFEVDMTSVGNKTVTIKYQNVTATFEIEVLAKILTKLELGHLPNKTEYVVDEELDTKGLVVNAIYNNGQIIDVTKKCILTVDTSKVGEQIVYVSYEDKYGDASLTFNIVVKEKNKGLFGCAGEISALYVTLPICLLSLIGLLLIRRKYIINK